MYRGSLPLVALLASVALLSACGSEPVSYTDGEISDGLALKADGKTYLVATKDEPEGDPFCLVTDLLNDANEVERAGERAEGLAVSSRAGSAGIVTEAPFGCEAEAQRNLNRLDPKPKDG